MDKLWLAGFMEEKDSTDRSLKGFDCGLKVEVADCGFVPHLSILD
jgi:hypothetical protein